MINKQGLWFLTLFSLILVLSIYYITMPNDLLSNNSNIKNKIKVENTNKEVDDKKVEVKESELLVTMRVNLDDERNKKLEELKKDLTSEEKSKDEKNSAYEQIKYINELTALENTIEKQLKKEYDLDSFVKIDNDKVKVVVLKEKHDVTLANNIMKLVQSNFNDKKIVTIQFEK